jgi:sporulation protein YlmC with PRC-barrel domain
MSGLEFIVGKEVISADAKIIGTVEGIAVDVDNWKVPAIRMSVRKGIEASLNLKRRWGCKGCTSPLLRSHP